MQFTNNKSWKGSEHRTCRSVQDIQLGVGRGRARIPPPTDLLAASRLAGSSGAAATLRQHPARHAAQRVQQRRQAGSRAGRAVPPHGAASAPQGQARICADVAVRAATPHTPALHLDSGPAVGCQAGRQAGGGLRGGRPQPHCCQLHACMRQLQPCMHQPVWACPAPAQPPPHARPPAGACRPSARSAAPPHPPAAAPPAASTAGPAPQPPPPWPAGCTARPAPPAQTPPPASAPAPGAAAPPPHAARAAQGQRLWR